MKTLRHTSVFSGQTHRWEFKRHISPLLSAVNPDPGAAETAEEFGRTTLAADAFDDPG